MYNNIKLNLKSYNAKFVLQDGLYTNNVYDSVCTVTIIQRTVNEAYSAHTTGGGFYLSCDCK